MEGHKISFSFLWMGRNPRDVAEAIAGQLPPTARAYIEHEMDELDIDLPVNIREQIIGDATAELLEWMSANHYTLTK